mgnify:CR=1 FL=1
MLTGSVHPSRFPRVHDHDASLSPSRPQQQQLHPQQPSRLQRPDSGGRRFSLPDNSQQQVPMHMQMQMQPAKSTLDLVAELGPVGDTVMRELAFKFGEAPSLVCL